MHPATEAVVGIGSNLGDPAAQVRGAIVALARLRETELLGSSGLYRSPPMGPQDQPDYVNAVALLRTRLAPLALLDELQAIERRHGRVRAGARWGPRVIDLDLLLWGEDVISEPRLTVPHPGLHERPFVLYPLAEIAPRLLVPGRGRVRDLAAACSAADLVKL